MRKKHIEIEYTWFDHHFPKMMGILISIVSIFSLVMLWLLFIPIKVIEPQVQPYKLATKSVKAGESFTYIVDACKYMDVPAKISLVFVDIESRTQYPPVIEDSSIVTGCNQTRISRIVPPFLLAGRTYSPRLDITYKINALRDVIYHFKIEDLHVE